MLHCMFEIQPTAISLLQKHNKKFGVFKLGLFAYFYLISNMAELIKLCKTLFHLNYHLNQRHQICNNNDFISNSNNSDPPHKRIFS